MHNHFHFSLIYAIKNYIRERVLYKFVSANCTTKNQKNENPLRKSTGRKKLKEKFKSIFPRIEDKNYVTVLKIICILSDFSHYFTYHKCNVIFVTKFINKIDFSQIRQFFLIFMVRS